MFFGPKGNTGYTGDSPLGKVVKMTQEMKSCEHRHLLQKVMPHAADWMSHYQAKTVAKLGLDPRQLHACKKITQELWGVAKGVLHDRFNSLFWSLDQSAPTVMHEIGLQFLDQASEAHDSFLNLVTAEMSSHLLSDAYTVNHSYNEPTPCLLPCSKKCKKDALYLGGTLIANVEALLLDFGECMHATASEPLLNGVENELRNLLPDTSPNKHWEQRAYIQSRRDGYQKYARDDRAQKMSCRHRWRANSAKRLALSRRELLLQRAFQIA